MSEKNKEAIDYKLPDGHICENGRFKPYIQLVCSMCSPKYYQERDSNVYFAQTLMDKGESMAEPEELLPNEEPDNVCERTTVGKLFDLENALYETTTKLQEVTERTEFLEKEYEFIVEGLAAATELLERLTK